MTGPVVEREDQAIRLRCSCGGRASIGTGIDNWEEWARWWLREHAFCGIDTRAAAAHKQRTYYAERVGREVKITRCTNCDGPGHNRRRCPAPVDSTGDERIRE